MKRRQEMQSSGCSSVGRASAFHAECRGFESRRPLQVGSNQRKAVSRESNESLVEPASRVSKLKSGFQPDFTSRTSLLSVSNHRPPATPAPPLVPAPGHSQFSYLSSPRARSLALGHDKPGPSANTPFPNRGTRETHKRTNRKPQTARRETRKPRNSRDS